MGEVGEGCQPLVDTKQEDLEGDPEGKANYHTSPVPTAATYNHSQPWLIWSNQEVEVHFTLKESQIHIYPSVLITCKGHPRSSTTIIKMWQKQVKGSQGGGIETKVIKIPGGLLCSIKPSRLK